MLRWIVGSSLKGRFLVIGLAGALMFFGTLQLRDSPVDVFPEFAPPRVEVQTSCLGLSAAEVESLVTTPLEQGLNGLPRLDTMPSKSVATVSSIELTSLAEQERITQQVSAELRAIPITTQGCSAIPRPTWPSGSARCSPSPATRSQSGSSATTSPRCAPRRRRCGTRWPGFPVPPP